MWLNVDMTRETRQKFTTKEVADLYVVSHERVTSWIRSGRLKAEDIANGSRTVYRISGAQLDAFDQANST